MWSDVINRIRADVKYASPLIHCITNPISVNQCANAVLAVGARPIMAEHPREAAEITETASALCLNLGNITDARMESMMISIAAAKRRGIPVVLDLVGIACSRLRRELALKLISANTPCILKGNYSEIAALSSPSYKSAGVDADKTLNAEYMDKTALTLSSDMQTAILASGKTDVICGGGKLIHINNGTPRLSQITGTGCMLGALAACFLAVCGGVEAAAAACAVLGISGSLADTDKGSGTFMVRLMDSISTLSYKQLQNSLKMEVIGSETI